MAATFKRIKTANIGLTDTTLYTVPANTKAIVIGFTIANKAATQIKIKTSVSGVQITGTDTPIPAGSALSILDGKMVLEAGDVVSALSDTASATDSFISLVEMT